MNALSNLLDDLLLSDAYTDICINGASEIYVDQGHGLRPLAPSKTPYSLESFTDDDLKLWVLSQLAKIGKSWDAKHPFVDAQLLSGHRIHVVFSPLAKVGTLVSLRKSANRNTSEKGSTRWKESPLYPVLVDAIQDGHSILISGATGSGKTTLAADLLEEVSHQERIIALEDTPELAPRHPHFLSLISRPPNADGCGEISLRTLMKQTLRMRPDRIVLGECRGNEVLELLQALNTGHQGALATLHSNSPRDALRRLELLCLISAGDIGLPLGAIRELLAGGIRWIAQVNRVTPPDSVNQEIRATRKITALHRIEGREGDTILMRPVLQPEDAYGTTGNSSDTVSVSAFSRGHPAGLLKRALPRGLVSQV